MRVLGSSHTQGSQEAVEGAVKLGRRDYQRQKAQFSKKGKEEAERRGEKRKVRKNQAGPLEAIAPLSGIQS